MRPHSPPRIWITSQPLTHHTALAAPLFSLRDLRLSRTSTYYGLPPLITPGQGVFACRLIFNWQQHPNTYHQHPYLLTIVFLRTKKAHLSRCFPHRPKKCAEYLPKALDIPCQFLTYYHQQGIIEVVKYWSVPNIQQDVFWGGQTSSKIVPYYQYGTIFYCFRYFIYLKTV